MRLTIQSTAATSTVAMITHFMMFEIHSASAVTLCQAEPAP